MVDGAGRTGRGCAQKRQAEQEHCVEVEGLRARALYPGVQRTLALDPNGLWYGRYAVGPVRAVPGPGRLCCPQARAREVSRRPLLYLLAPAGRVGKGAHGRRTPEYLSYLSNGGRYTGGY